MNRYKEEGYELVVQADSRRGLWFRTTDKGMEICAGREGDDEYVFLKVGEKLTRKDIQNLKECFYSLAWAVEVSNKLQGE